MREFVRYVVDSNAPSPKVLHLETTKELEPRSVAPVSLRLNLHILAYMIGHVAPRQDFTALYSTPGARDALAENTAATVRQRDPDGPTAPPRRCPRKHAAAHICNRDRDRGPVPDPVNSLLWGSAEELLPHEHQRLSK